MKKIILSLFVVILSFLPVKGQDISGRVVDSKNHPLEYVNVSLLSKQDSAMIVGGVTDENGRYTLKYSTSLDDVLIKMSLVGYQTLFLAPKQNMEDVVLVER